jgi:hypothetical protein
VTLIPYMVATIAGAFGWAIGKKIEGVFTGSVLSLVASFLGWYYGKKYLDNLKDMMGR